MSALGYQWINFIILALGLAFLLNKKLGVAFRNQRKELEEKISQANEKYTSAKSALDKVQELVHRLDSKVSEMKSNATKEVGAEIQKIEKECEQAVAKILSDGEARIKGDIEKSKQLIEKELWEKAVGSTRAALQKELTVQDPAWTAQMIQQAENSSQQGKKNYAS